jgi:hypothetical protein
LLVPLVSMLPESDVPVPLVPALESDEPVLVPAFASDEPVALLSEAPPLAAEPALSLPVPVPGLPFVTALLEPDEPLDPALEPVVLDVPDMLCFLWWRIVLEPVVAPEVSEDVPVPPVAAPVDFPFDFFVLCFLEPVVAAPEVPSAPMVSLVPEVPALPVPLVPVLPASVPLVPALPLSVLFCACATPRPSAASAPARNIRYDLMSVSPPFRGFVDAAGRAVVPGASARRGATLTPR